MFDQAQVQASVFVLYSIGVAAENVEFGGTTELEVLPGEQMQGLDGDVTTNQENMSAEGQDAIGRKYTQNINTGNVVRAKWLSRNTNRPFPSLVRRGESVMIWRNSDSDEFWWEEMGKDIRYRRGDIYTIACISTIVNPEDPISMENSYWFEIDSLNGIIRFSTTDLNGEQCRYLVEIMAKEGKLLVEDTIGNYLRLDSVDQRWRIVNAAGTELDMFAENTTLTMAGKMTINAQNMDFNIEQLFKVIATDMVQEIGNSITTSSVTHEVTTEANYTLNSLVASMNASTSYSISAPTIGLNGALTSLGFGGGAGSAKFVGSMDIEGETTMDGNTTVTGVLMNDGKNVTTHNHRGDSGGNTGPMQ